jgi:hypothetical protein
MEVAGSQESLAKVDDAKQEELLAAYAQFLNSLTFPFQIVVQVHPLTSLVRGPRRGTCSLSVLRPGRDCPRPRCVCPESYAAANLARAPHLRRRPVVGSAEDRAPGPSLSVPWRRRQIATADDQLHVESVQRLLADRCDVISRNSAAPGLRATRLDDLGLAQLYHVAWAPEVAAHNACDGSWLITPRWWSVGTSFRRPHEHALDRSTTP